MSNHTGRHGAAAVVLATVLSASGALAAPFTNGSFETGPDPGVSFLTLAGGDTQLPGWTVTGNSVDYIGGYWVSRDGSRSLDLDGGAPGGVSQTFDTVPGTLYRVTFWLAGNPECGATIKSLSVSATGNPSQAYTFDTSGHSTSSMGWVQQTYDFRAWATTATLTFASTDASGACGPALDDVSVASVDPVPATSPAGDAATVAAILALGIAMVSRRRLS